jgi:hypothetical protein
VWLAKQAEVFFCASILVLLLLTERSLEQIHNVSSTSGNAHSACLNSCKRRFSRTLGNKRVHCCYTKVIVQYLTSSAYLRSRHQCLIELLERALLKIVELLQLSVRPVESVLMLCIAAKSVKGRTGVRTRKSVKTYRTSKQMSNRDSESWCIIRR